MTFLKIDPISTQSIGGHPVLIDGLDPSDHDCIHGEISFSNVKERRKWNLAGTIRNSAGDGNLDMKAGEVFEVAELARKLGALNPHCIPHCISQKDKG